MKRLSVSIAVIFSMAAAWAGEERTDITAQYLTNPSFEADDLTVLTPVNNQADGLRGYSVAAPQGWTVANGAGAVSLIVTKDCYTDNNFGLVTTLADGQQAYYLRMGWSTGTTTVSQTLKELPKGKYLLTADIRSAYANQAASSVDLTALMAGTSVAFTQGATGCFTTMAWTTSQLDFEQVADGDATIGFNVSWLSGGSCVMIDNVRLFKLADDYVQPEDPTEQDVESPTENTVLADFVSEPDMKADLQQMLANFATYMKNDFQECAAPNSLGEQCGCFRGENTMANDEKGVRPNADLSMICAFLVKYGKGKVTLPSGVTWEQLEDMAMKSLVFAYSTHKANKLKVCAGNNYWGSVSNGDHVWESSLWAMSVAYSAFFQWDKLTEAQKNYIYQLLKAECNYELERSIPTGYAGDTKAEENGWEADILAATLGLFPNDALAPKWFQRLREFAINSYSQKDDAADQTIIDPDYDETTVADLYKGQNLYDDYTLQNHNYFHTSYQNVVIQELGEAALALKLFQQGLYGTEKWKTNALMHNNDKVMQHVLYWLALADGELAMPNGNDWSLFLYDQITSYSTNACFLRDPHALMLENLAYKMIKARQTTTDDGSWLLRADVGARRMGVEAHRVMMTWLMHEMLPTDNMSPTAWPAFNRSFSQAKHFASQNIVRAATDSRFTCFSWSQGLQSYTGYIAANSVDKNKIIVPFRANNTGNFLGWYEVQGKGTNATPVVSGTCQLNGNSYVMNGELQTNDATLNNRFAIYSTPGNAVVYLDYVRANQDATVNKEKGGLMAISVDELTKTKRTLYYASPTSATDDGSQPASSYTRKQLDGSQFTTIPGPWVNIDNAIGIITAGDKQMAFGERANNNSVMTAKLYTSYSGQSRTVKQGDVVDRRAIVYYSNMSAAQTEALSHDLLTLTTPEGWNGVIVPDANSEEEAGHTCYLLLSNFASDHKCTLEGIRTANGSPVVSVPTTIGENGSDATFVAEENHAVANTLKFFVTGKDVTAVQEAGDSTVIYVRNDAEGRNTMTVKAVDGGQCMEKEVELDNKVVKLQISGGELLAEEAGTFPEEVTQNLTNGYTDITAQHLANASFEEDETYGKADGNVTLGSTAYNPCYVNTVSADNAKWPNVLPVGGWTAGNGLTGGSNFCRMYSMPYSTVQYCVSPSNVGNYAARCSRPMFDSDLCGNRVLTVLNSWDNGSNAITQTVTLPAGNYRVLMDVRYECPNQTAVESDFASVRTSGGNVCSSLIGISYADGDSQVVTDYRYPAERNTWQQLCFDFNLADSQPVPVTLSLGYQSTQSQGAANQTLLYIDNIRLLRANELPVGILSHAAPTYRPSLYDLYGRQVSGQPKKGIYIKEQRKVVVR